MGGGGRGRREGRVDAIEKAVVRSDQQASSKRNATALSALNFTQALTLCTMHCRGVKQVIRVPKIYKFGIWIFVPASAK